MKIVNSAYMSQGQAVPSKIYRPPKNNYVLMYLFSINTHTFTYPALPKAISCKQYYSWPMMFSLSLFSKKTWRQCRTCISWARGCVNINWGLELLEHTRYAAYNSVGIPHPLGALATTPKAIETTYENPCPLQTMHHPTFTSNISLMLLLINTPHGTTTSLCLISIHS